MPTSNSVRLDILLNNLSVYEFSDVK